MSYFNFKKRPSKTSELSKLIDKVDTAISEVVRLTASDQNGMCRCVTCGNEDHYLRMHCGHYVLRSNMATRFDLRNLNVQCPGCNCVMDGMEEKHGEFIDLLHGKGTADKLIALGREEKKWAPHELQGMLEELRKEVKALKLEKFGV